MFFRGSRYERVPDQTIVDAGGRTLRYKQVRFIPPTPAQARYIVSQDERLDRVAFHAFRDPERFWRICDANAALWPPDLVAEAGRTLDIPASEG
jgi:hypothetical protein